jgi:hypothetical protein
MSIVVEYREIGTEAWIRHRCAPLSRAPSFTETAGGDGAIIASGDVGFSTWSDDELLEEYIKHGQFSEECRTTDGAAVRDELQRRGVL